MDNETYRQLRAIGQTIPKDLLKKAIVKEQPLREGVKEYLDWQKKTTRFLSKDSAKKVNEIKEFLVKGAFDHKSTRVDERVEKKIENFVEGKVNYLIQTGKIKPPKLDPWAKRIMEKAAQKL